MWNFLCGAAGAYLALLGAQAFGCSNDATYISLLLGVMIGWGLANTFIVCFEDIEDSENSDDDKRGLA